MKLLRFWCSSEVLKPWKNITLSPWSRYKLSGGRGIIKLKLLTYLGFYWSDFGKQELVLKLRICSIGAGYPRVHLRGYPGPEKLDSFQLYIKVLPGSGMVTLWGANGSSDKGCCLTAPAPTPPLHLTAMKFCFTDWLRLLEPLHESIQRVPKMEASSKDRESSAWWKQNWLRSQGSQWRWCAGKA